MRPAFVRPFANSAEQDAGTPCSNSTDERRTTIESANALPVRRWQSTQ
jgi:hypothetical protein